MEFTAKVEGLGELQQIFNELGEQAPHEAGIALFGEGQEIIKKSKEILEAGHHVDTGNLVNSGIAKPPVIDGNVVTVQLGFGGPTAKYAYYVHEGSDPHDISAKDKKILAVPVQHYKGPVNPYGSGQFPMLSKDGNYVLFGKHVHHPGTKGVHYLSDPVEQSLPGVKEAVKKQLLKALRERLR